MQRRTAGLQSFFIRESTAPDEIKRARWRSLDAIVQYAEGGECRHSGILTYFKDTDRIQSCGHCDVCDPGSPEKSAPFLHGSCKDTYVGRQNLRRRRRLSKTS